MAAALEKDIVVIAVDESPFSERAFDYYVSHLHKDANTVFLVYCLEMPSIPSRDTWDSQTKAGKEKAKAVSDKFSAKLKERGIAAKFVTECEKPGEYICGVADKEGATMIVMGTRGMGKLRRTILGSVSNYVLNHAHCPVLVCRSPK